MAAENSEIEHCESGVADVGSARKKTAEETAGRYKAPSEVQPMRQFVLMFSESEAAEIELHLKTLQKAWGVKGAREVVAEALKRAIEAELATAK